MKPKHRYWAQQPLWTLTQAAYLFAGHSPPDDPTDAWIDPPPKAQTLHQRMKMAVATGELGPAYKVAGLRERCVRPPDLLRWAGTRKYVIPRQLRKLADTAKNAEDIGTRAKSTLLKLVLGMAEAKYGYDPTATRNDAIKRIVGDLERRELKLSDDSVRDWLRVAHETLRG